MSSRKVFKNLILVRFLPLITNLASFFNKKNFKKKILFGSCVIFFIFFHLSSFLFTVSSKYLLNTWCCILDYFILNCKLWDKFLNSMIILILIITYILMFYRNFELIFEFMALKRAPICGRNVCLFFFLRIFKSKCDNFKQRK